MSFGEMTQTSGLDSYNDPKFAPNVGRYRTRPLSRSEQFAKITTGNTILDSLGTEMASFLEPLLDTVELSQERVLFQEEDRLNTVYFPLTAVISEFLSLEDGRMVEIAVTGNEGAVGISSILSGVDTVHNFTQVSQAGTARTITAYNLNRVLHSHETLRHNFVGHTDAYIRQISQKAICNMYHSVKERLCTWLLMIQDRSGRSNMSLTHEQISRSLGVNRPSVSRMAHELRESKLISYVRGGVKIRDRERVEHAACTCYFELAAGSGALVH